MDHQRIFEFHENENWVSRRKRKHQFKKKYIYAGVSEAINIDFNPGCRAWLAKSIEE